MLYRYSSNRFVNMHIIAQLTRMKNIFFVREDGQLKVGIENYKISTHRSQPQTTL